MQKLIPLESFTIVTPDTTDAVQKRLKQCLFYRGDISEQGFKIFRNYYRRVPVTLIKGHFKSQSHQTSVHIKISPHPYFIVLLALLGLIFWIYHGSIVPNAFESYTYVKPVRTPVFSPDNISSDGGFVKSVIESTANSTERTMPAHLALLYLASPIIVLIIFWAAFWSNVKDTRRDLTLIIRGEI